MSNKNTLFYRKNKAILIDFSASEISSDGSLILLEKIEREHKLLNRFSKYLPDLRNPRLITYTREDQLKQRVFMMMLGYEDANDVIHLQHDPLFKDVLQGDLALQPTIYRFENSLDKRSIFEFSDAWVNQYVATLKGRKSIVIDIDATDDPTHGNQQMSMFNGYYGQFMLNELFFHDGETGQIILPVLRPGNSHSNKWYVAILKRIIIKIRKSYPKMEIIIRTDSGFSCAPFYKLVDDYSLLFATGIASNSVLKKKVLRVEKAVKQAYLKQGKKYQHFISFNYQAKSWHKEQQCYSKIESTGKGIRITAPPLGRKPKIKQNQYQKAKRKKEAAERNHIEGKFRQGKNGYNLNNIRAKLKETSESWVSCIFFVMNLINYQKKYFSVLIFNLHLSILSRIWSCRQSLNRINNKHRRNNEFLSYQ